MMKLKKCKVVLLSTDGESMIHLVNGKVFLFKDDHLEHKLDSIPHHHLYFLVDEELKKGDCTITYSDSDNEVIDMKDDHHAKNCMFFKQFQDSDAFWKIIATTDPNLKLPSPSKAFIEKYIKKNGIDEVFVRYDGKSPYVKNNKISTFSTERKEVYDREDVIELIRKLCDSYSDALQDEMVEKFIKENL